MSSRDQDARTDNLGRAFAGSQLQIQLYVNRRQGELNAAIVTALGSAISPGAEIVWRSPLESKQFAECMDGAFLDALGLSHLKAKLAAFWPRSGPRWDGLATCGSQANPDTPTYLLAEAKGYPEEIFGPGCRARPGSRPKQLIEKALRDTKAWAGAEESANWEGRLYQYANRLAHVFFLREAAGLKAWLVNLCFLNDPRTPRDCAEWEAGLAAIREELGFRDRPIPYTVNVFLAARDRSELANQGLSTGGRNP
jgi:hypothetical protein